MNLANISTGFVTAITASGITQDSISTLFATHKTTDVFFISSDGQAFFKLNMAEAHSQKLKPTDVLELTREDWTAAISGALDLETALDSELKEEQAAEQKAAADKAAAEAKAAEDKAAADLQAQIDEKAAADAKAAADKAIADAKAATDKLAADQKAAADKSAAAEGGAK